jgi:hypothetical protein
MTYRHQKLSHYLADAQLIRMTKRSRRFKPLIYWHGTFAEPILNKKMVRSSEAPR